MPVLEFALDPAAQHRIQVHIPTEQTVFTVMLNRSVLGFLATPAEQTTGKYFVLPDRSTLYVRIDGRQPQVFRNSLLLSPLDPREAASDGSSAGRTRKAPGGGLFSRLTKVSGRE